MKKDLPVFNIENFLHFSKDHDFYVDDFLPHIRNHDFTNKPHKHDFYMVVFFTAGTGSHEIDFTTYKVCAGSVFFLQPGQTHHWQLSDNIEGIIFFHTGEFFDKGFTKIRLRDFPFFSSIYNSPFLLLQKRRVTDIARLFREIKDEYNGTDQMKDGRLLSLVNLLYTDLTRLYGTTKAMENENYLHKLKAFESLVETNFKTMKSPAVYAALMHLTSRHLNRICKSCLDKTSSEIVLDRVILEAKRLLMRTEFSISEVATNLGYSDNSYFSRLFKKHSGKSPREFVLEYQ